MNSLRRRWAHKTAIAALLVLVASFLGLAASPASAHTETKSGTLTNAQTQQGRIFRDAVPSVCGTAKVYPTLFSPASTYNYQTQTYVAVATGCLTVTRTLADCTGAETNSVNVHVSLYAGVYNPASQATNYVGDQGSSDNAVPFGVNVTAGQTYTLVESNTGAQTNCSAQIKLEQEPDTKITPPTGPRDTPVLSFSGSDAATFQCSVDSGAFAPCTSPKSLPGLSAGQHTLAVKAVDSDGKIDATPATQSFTRCDLPKLTADVTNASNSVKKATSKLKAAKRSGKPAKVKKAKAKLKKAKAALKAAQAAASACPA